MGRSHFGSSAPGSTIFTQPSAMVSCLRSSTPKAAVALQLLVIVSFALYSVALVFSEEAVDVDGLDVPCEQKRSVDFVSILVVFFAGAFFNCSQAFEMPM